jgi:hypothetical protein
VRGQVVSLVEPLLLPGGSAYLGGLFLLIRVIAHRRSNRNPIDPERKTAMKTRHSILTLAVTASLVLGASTAQAMTELGGGATSAGAKSASQTSAARLKALRSESVQLLQLMNQYKKQAVHQKRAVHYLRPDDRAGVHGVAP